MRRFVLSVVLGALLTFGSLLATHELHPTSTIVGDGFAGDARVMGAPWPYTYELTSDRNQEAMRLQAHCYITPFCFDYAGHNPRDDAFSIPPFLGDLAVWTALAAALLAVGRRISARLSTAPSTVRRRRSVPE